jgi:hypothetical protein
VFELIDNGVIFVGAALTVEFITIEDKIIVNIIIADKTLL